MLPWVLYDFLRDKFSLFDFCSIATKTWKKQNEDLFLTMLHVCTNNANGTGLRHRLTYIQCQMFANIIWGKVPIFCQHFAQHTETFFHSTRCSLAVQEFRMQCWTDVRAGHLCSCFKVSIKLESLSQIQVYFSWVFAEFEWVTAFIRYTYSVFRTFCPFYFIDTWKRSVFV